MSDSKKKNNKGGEGGSTFERLPFFITGKNMPFNYVEAFKELRTNLSFTTKAGVSKCIVITSSLSEEGKTNLSMNLASALAMDNKKVILVDCDLRKPALHHYLNIKHNVHGVSNILIGEDTAEKCILSSKSMGFSILTAGSTPPNPSELLALPSMSELVEQLKEKYDFVLLDSPPASLVTDAAVLSKYSDGVLMVVRSNFASREVIKAAKAKLDTVHANILGTVLTRFNMKDSARYGKYGRYGRYGKYSDYYE